jgi:hypothetical protein
MLVDMVVIPLNHTNNNSSIVSLDEAMVDKL